MMGPLRTSALAALRAGMRAPACASLSRVSAAKAFHTSPVARDSHDTSASDEGPYTTSNMLSPTFYKTVAFLVAGYGLYKVNETAGLDEESDDRRPWLTRYLAYQMPDREEAQRLNEQHMEFARERAALKLFLQDAEHPPITRMRGGALNYNAGPSARQSVGA